MKNNLLTVLTENLIEIPIRPNDQLGHEMALVLQFSVLFSTPNIPDIRLPPTVSSHQTPLNHDQCLAIAFNQGISSIGEFMPIVIGDGNLLTFARGHVVPRDKSFDD